MTDQPTADTVPDYVRFTPYEDTCAQLLTDPVKLLAETGRLLGDMQGILAAGTTGVARVAPETVTIPAQPPVAPARRPR